MDRLETLLEFRLSVESYFGVAVANQNLTRQGRGTEYGPGPAVPLTPEEDNQQIDMVLAPGDTVFINNAMWLPFGDGRYGDSTL